MALINTGREYNLPLHIASAASRVNEERKDAMASRVIAALHGNVEGKTVGVLGLTFKPNTDDMREAPSLRLISALARAGARIRAYDPEGMGRARPLLSSVLFCDNPYDCAQGADALVLVTEWESFRALDLERLRGCLRHPVVVDLRNIYTPEEMAACGYVYFSVGRGTAARKLLDRFEPKRKRLRRAS
jgi:UDPglucose 6-dehydrogenase